MAVCAIETSRIGDRNFIAGLPKTLRNQKKMKKILAKHWEIYDEEEARNQIAQLPAARGYLGVDKASIAWDCCRDMQLIGYLFLCDYIDRQEMRELFCQVGRNIQEKFASWTDLCGHYLKGYANWRSTLDGKAEKDIEERKAIYRSLKSDRNGPYHLHFKMSLSEEITNEPDIVKVGAGYCKSCS